MAAPRKRQDQARDLLERLGRVESGTIPRALILVGQARRQDRVAFDDGQASLLVRGLREWARGTGQREWVEHDPSTATFRLDVLCSDLCSASLFGEPRVLYVPAADNLAKPAGRRKAGERTAFEQAVLAFLETEDRGDRLLVVLREGSTETVLAKDVVDRGGEAWMLRPLYRDPPPWDPDPLHTEMARICLARCRGAGLKLDAGAVLMVMDRLGGDLGRMDSEIEKLRLLADSDGRVSGGEVSDTVASSAVDVDAYAFADHVIRGDLARALGWLRAVSRRGGRREGGGALGLADVIPRLQHALLGEMRKMVVAAEMREDGQPADLIAAALRVPDNTIARESFRRRLHARDHEGFVAMLRALRELELELKWEGVPSEVALDRFVMRTCSPRRVP